MRISDWSSDVCSSDLGILALELHGDLAIGIDADEIAHRVAADIALGGGEHDVELAPAALVLGQGQYRGDLLALGQRQQVDQRLAARQIGRASCRESVW